LCGKTANVKMRNMGGPDTSQLFELAGRHHRAGKWGEAERLYRQVLASEPGNADALHMLGVLNAQAGNYPAAASLIRRAIALKPNDAGYHANLGNVLQESGHLEEATAAYRRALQITPNIPEAYNNLGNALQQTGEVDQALAEYQRAIEARPQFPEAHFNRGNALQKKERWDDAIAAYLRALALRPDYAEAHLNLGMALFEKGDVGAAIEAYGRALALRADLAEAHANLGRALLHSGRHDEAIAAFGRALAVRPDQPDVEHELGNALRELGRLDEAIAAYRRSLATRPDFPDSHFGLAWTYLFQGDYERGWPEYEWRNRLRDAEPHASRFSAPRWKGGPLDGRRILLYAEQGFGDTLLAFRYVPMVLARGGRVVLQCPAPLLRLMQSQPGAEQVIEDQQSIPAVDAQCPLMTLPGIFATRLETIPSRVPYIFPQPQLVATWKQRLNRCHGKIAVGLCWSGKPVPRNRSVPLSMLSPLAQSPNVEWHSLQVGESAAAARNAPFGVELADWSDQLTDFAQTAALIANLDLIITIDTAVAHLAGAMGKPTWVMLQYSPDWRWLLNRDDSPWFPTIRLFRQPRQGNWVTVIEKIRHELGHVGAGYARP
jgi:tetratricopeptide (TPR) repeat protein